MEKITAQNDITINQACPVYWSTVRNTIVITYIGGVDLATVQDVVMAFYEIVGILTGIKTRTYITNDGEESVTTSIGSMPKYVMLILNKHIRRNV